MPLLAFLGPLKCVCRVVTAFFMAFLIFPAAAETASPPISGSNGLMGLWGANSSAPQTGSSGKPISGSNEQQGATAPGTPTESSPPSADSQDAELELSRPSAPRNRAAAHIRFQWADGTVGRKQLGTADGLKWKADQRFKRPTGHHCSWHSHRVESTKRGCTGCRAQVESTGCRARVEVHQARHEMSRLRPVLNPVPMD